MVGAPPYVFFKTIQNPLGYQPRDKTPRWLNDEDFSQNKMYPLIFWFN